MATIDDIPLQHWVKVKNLFRAENFCFSTHDAGRTPTYYFASGGLNCLCTAILCGRLRTQHPKGPLVDVTQCAKQHMFYDTKAHQVAAYRALGDANSQAGIDAVVTAARTAPQVGNFHLEFTKQARGGRMCSRRHRSGGLVRLAPRVPSDDVAIQLVQHILANNGDVKVDGHSIL